MVSNLSTNPIAETGPTESPHEWRREAIRHHATYLLLTCILLGLAALLQIDAQDHVVVPGVHITLPQSCIYHRVVGVGCPGCGLTRSFICLLNGRWTDAWAYNPGGYLIFLVVALQLPYRGIQILRIVRGKPEFRHSTLSSLIVLLIVAVLLGQWIVRSVAS